MDSKYYYDKVSELVKAAGINIILDFDTVMSDFNTGELSPEDSAKLFIEEYS